MSEASAQRTLMKRLKAYGGVHCQRIEDQFSVGIPDMNIAVFGLGEAWLEGKFLKDYPKRPGTPIKIGLRDAQLAWLHKRSLIGSNVAVWCRHPEGWWLFTNHFEQLWRGVPRNELEELAAWSGKRLDMSDFLGEVFA